MFQLMLLYQLLKTIYWNKYQSKVTIQHQNQYLDYSVDPSFQGLNGLFILSFPDNAFRTGYAEYFMSSVEMKD